MTQVWKMPIIDSGKTNIPISIQTESKELESTNEGGYKAGYESGYQSGLDKASSEINLLKEAFCESIRLLETPISLINNIVKQQILELVELLTKTILEKTIIQEPEFLMKIIEKTVAELPFVNSRIKIYVNQNDNILLEKNIADLKLNLEKIEFLVDVQLTQGECRVTSEESSIDASIAGRIKTLMESDHEPTE